MGCNKDILLSIQAHLSNQFPGLWVDKDWGQLNYAQPQVQWPCALIDIGDITYSQMGKGCQLADIQIAVTLANQRTASSSSTAPNPEDAYRLVDLLDEVHDSLQFFRAGVSAPLFRTSQKKVFADSSIEAYQLIYQTQYVVGYTESGETSDAIGPDNLEVKIMGDDQ